MSETPLVYGHRGASVAATENTLEAFRIAAEQGADGVELDVRRSADGSLVLHHDAGLGDGRIISATLAADLPVHIPTLDAALVVCEGLIVNIEIKNIPGEPDFDETCSLADEVVALLHERGDRDRVVISSFHLRTIDRVKELAPDVATGFLCMLDPLPADGVGPAARRGHDAIHPHHLLVDDALVAAAHAAGLTVNVWTVDDPDELAHLARLGVDAVVTNVPDVALGVLRRE
ncbi:MAG: glycerophosphodiester phosphodiesterase [Acidimicrobiales bacterium]|nr:glycerophosphodiester phosphodiesterase [Acidimicrobiales bacterium]